MTEGIIQSKDRRRTYPHEKVIPNSDFIYSEIRHFTNGQGFTIDEILSWAKKPLPSKFPNPHYILMLRDSKLILMRCWFIGQFWMFAFLWLFLRTWAPDRANNLIIVILLQSFLISFSFPIIDDKRVSWILFTSQII